MPLLLKLTNELSSPDLLINQQMFIAVNNIEKVEFLAIVLP